MPKTKKLKVLIIEDEENLIDLLCTKLQNAGYEVFKAADGKDGYNKIKKEKPDLILLDIVMPVMNGYEVLEKMNEEKIKIPVIIISNSGQPVEIEKTKKLGAVDHLIKTEFSPVDVIKKVENYLKSDKKNKDGINQPEPIEGGSSKLGVKVLLVEDDQFLREICGNKLVGDGYTVYTAIDGEEAIDLVKKVKPDIVLLDIILPSVDGFQILNHIRQDKNKQIAKTPIIMLSNLGQDSDIKKALDMGANDFLIKANFTTKEISKRINKILEENK